MKQRGKKKKGSKGILTGKDAKASSLESSILLINLSDLAIFFISFSILGKSSSVSTSSPKSTS